MSHFTFYVYHLIDPRTNDPFYVGKGSGDRVYDHLIEFDKWNSKGRPRRLGNLNIYKLRKIAKILSAGLYPVYFKVFEVDDEQAALNMEKEEIARIGRRNLTNLTDGGDGILDLTGDIGKKISNSKRGKRFSLEHRKKLSEAAKNRKSSIETRRKISDSLTGIGRNFTQEHKRKLSEAAKSRPPVTSETREKLSKIHKGKKKSEEHIKKVSDALRGRKIPQDQRRKMSLAAKNRKSGAQNG